MNKQENVLLVVEDDIGIQNQLKWCFDDFAVAVASTRDEAITQLRQHAPEVVLLDLGLPPDPGGASEGLATLKQLLQHAPEIKIIVVTGNDDRDNAIKCIAEGAYDYYQKPIDAETINHVVKRAHVVFALEQENRQLHQHQESYRLPGIIATSKQMLQICRDVEKIAPSNISTLLLGESGTGKELLAQALHSLSPRANKPLIAINCAAIPGNLLESELFGYEKGAFTGADKQTPGKIEFANEGTLFLDEVGDLPLELQAKMLRFLQERVIERVGGRSEIPIDVRIITATHKDLPQLIEDGLFREDLYYRIGEIKILIPPLREREADVLLLAKTLLTRFSKELGQHKKSFSAAALDALEQHTWPGNIREMENLIKRAVVMSETNRILPADLELLEAETEQLPLNLKQVRDEAERSAIYRALQRSDNIISQTARLLGVTRPTLYDLLDKHNLRTSK